MAAKRVPAAPATPAAKPSTTKRAAQSTSSSTAASTAATKVSKTPARGRAGKAAEPSPSPAPARAAPPPTVTLKQLAARLAEAHAMPRKQSEAVLAELVGLIVEHLKAGDRLRIGGLGILEVRHRPARQGRNPATGESIQIAASKKFAFRPAKELKAAV